jgi:glycosyltransferase involved in cell wall biosynthesis
MVINLSYNYILITTAKNEEKKLPLLANSIIEQSIKPKLWFVLNDASNDKTQKILSDLKKYNNWIFSMDLKESMPHDLGKHFSILLNTAFKNAIEISDGHRLNYEYIGKVDADIMLPKNHFEILIKKMKKDSKIGVAGPELKIIDGNNIKSFQDIIKCHLIKENNSLLNDPSDAIRLFRKECFFDSWDFKINYAPDLISTARAKSFGWKTRRFKDIIAYHYGKTSDTGGSWKGLKFNGYENYYLGIPIFIVLFQTIRILIGNQDINAIAFLYGYLISSKNNNDRIKDSEIRNYFKYQYPKEIKKALINRIRILK